MEWERSAPIRSVEAPGLGRIDKEYRGVRTGDHVAGGLIVAAGAKRETARSGPHDSIDVVDLAPTITTALGITLNRDGVVQERLRSVLAAMKQRV